MDGSSSALREKLSRAMRDAAELAAALQHMERKERGGPEIPHYREIELAAHAVSQELSRLIQQRTVRELVAQSGPEAACPTCGERVAVEHGKRTMNSIDGPVEVWESQGDCDRCRRSFFPSA